MRFVISLAFLVAVLGLVLGFALRSALGRERFALVAVLSLVPLLGHATYLGVVSWRSGVLPSALLPFVLAVLLLFVVGATLARRWTRTAPFLAAFLPAFALIVYAVIASLLFSLSLDATGVVPDAVMGVALGLVTLALVMTLLVFVPQPLEPGRELRLPWRRS